MISELILTFILVSQDQPAAPNANSAATPTPSPKAENTLAPVGESNLSYTYNPFGKRDPFRSFVSEKAGAAKESKDPLLNFDLGKFLLTGLVWGITNPRAIVVDGDGRGHVISRGTRIGRNRGQVIRILKDEVVIAEEYRDPLGKLMMSEFVLKLNKEDRK